MLRNSEYRGIIIGNIWDDNKAAFSQLRDFARTAITPSNVIGIKYVIKGCENYYLDQRTHSVKDGSFFLVNSNRKLETLLDSGKTTTGLCFNIEKKLLSDVYNNYTSSDQLLLDQHATGLPDFNFTETIYRADDHLSQYLSSLKHHLNTVTGELMVEKEQLFYDIAKNLLLAQSVVRKQMLQIRANKKATREELFRRVSEARNIIDDSVLKPISIEEIAASVALSEFHFFRVFKQVYGISPYQYQMGQRLKRSKILIEKGILISDAAEANGFADISSFNKAFKKAFGVSPGQMRMRNENEE
ncbi:MAG: hypothetical protein K0S32_7 [Bacteroidetes bacterium]|jgi:AraC-like DNA-binding protein|nr:hypothetical protein [Bacteroidota bacterium]